MKSLRLSILAFLVLPLAAAQAGDLDWSGVYRIEGNIFDNAQVGTGDKKRKEYGIHHLILRPKIVGADGLYINSQLEVFNSNAGATGAWGNQLGAVFGNGINDNGTAITAGNSGTSNTLSESQDPEQIVVSQFYLTFVQEFGSFIAGRAPVQFGLGMTHNAGRGLFDHYADTRDLVGYKVVLGNFFILPMIGKVNEGGIGGYDVFKTVLENGVWSKPVNMGQNINTAENESTPFVGADSKTIYFSTPGFAGYGDNDIFLSRRLDSTWTNWSEPENLGNLINTARWDGYFTIPASGEFAYLSSEERSIGGEDIFRIKLFPSIKPDPVAIISGTVINAFDKKPMAANVVMELLNDKKALKKM